MYEVALKNDHAQFVNPDVLNLFLFSISDIFHGYLSPMVISITAGGLYQTERDTEDFCSEC